MTVALTARAVVAALALGACSVVPSAAPSTPSEPASAPPSATARATAAERATSLPPSGPPVPRPTQRTLDPAAIGLRAEVVAVGFSAPLQVTNAGDGSGRLFVVEQGGRILVVRHGQVGREPFLDLRDRVGAGGERGLLGLAFSPAFPADRRFFVDYTDPGGTSVISSFVAGSGPDADRADPASERVLLRIAQPYPNHNGGGLAFGPDGLLYIGLGDGGGSGDPSGNGQRTDTLLGKLLRIDVTPPPDGRPYAVPPGNPFASGGGAPEIWAIGLRNPWRFSFDRLTGALWIGDVGQNRSEEIDRTPAGAAPPVNYGWNRMEGSRCFEPASGCDRTGLTLPIAEYGHDAGCAVTGGFVARGDAVGALSGVYLFGDVCSGRIWGLDANGPDRQEPVLLLESGRSISSFGEDEAGRILFTDLARGEVIGLVPAGLAVSR